LGAKSPVSKHPNTGDNKGGGKTPQGRSISFPFKQPFTFNMQRDKRGKGEEKDKLTRGGGGTLPRSRIRKIGEGASKKRGMILKERTDAGCGKKATLVGRLKRGRNQILPNQDLKKGKTKADVDPGDRHQKKTD